MNSKTIYKQFLAFLRKEFYHVLRDKKTLLILFGIPIVQILIFGFALTNEVKNAKIMIVAPNENVVSQQIISKIKVSEYFSVKTIESTPRNVMPYLKNGKIECALIFPSDFTCIPLKNNTVQVITDGTDPNFSKTVTNYINAIIGEYVMEHNAEQQMPMQIQSEVNMLYNPELNGSMIFIPGVIAMIMMIVCCTLTAVSIVREKELGSMEVLLASPLKPILIMIAKALPYLFLSILNLVVILLLSYFVLNVPFNGSVILLFLISIIFLISCLAFGLVISNITSSQDVAMLISMVGMLLPTILFTGFLFPLENMPLFFQWLANLVPARWYFIITQDIMIKGLGFASVWKETLVLAAMVIILLFISIKKFNIRLA